MYRTELIQYYINTRNYQSYLELGVYDSTTYNRIICSHKDSVDCYYPAVYSMTTDQFFANPTRRRYDVIFIDADHREKQADKDIQNSLLHLNHGGVIVLHDCNPLSEYNQVEENGLNQTVWKSFAKYAYVSPYYCFCIPDDEGLGVIDSVFPKSQFYLPSLDYDNLQYSDLENHRGMLLNMKSTLVEAYRGMAC